MSGHVHASKTASPSTQTSASQLRVPARTSVTTEAPHIQAKLEVGSPDDDHEREADAVADRVMTMGTPPAPPNGLGGLPWPIPVMPRSHGGATQPELATVGEGERLQRACAECEEGHEELQRDAEPGARPIVDAVFERELGQLRRSGGAPLGSDTRRFMESRFGHSFGDVRVHASDGAASLAKRMRAKAFTVGHDVVFGRGQYRPQAPSGRRLLAHELVHALQQSTARGPPTLRRTLEGGASVDETSMEDAPIASVVGHRVEQLEHGVVRLTTSVTPYGPLPSFALIGEVAVEREVTLWELFVGVLSRWGPEGPLRVGHHRAVEVALKLVSARGAVWDSGMTFAPGSRVPIILALGEARRLWNDVVGFELADREPSDAEATILAHPELFIAFERMQVATTRRRAKGVFDPTDYLGPEVRATTRFHDLLRGTEAFDRPEEVEAVRDQYTEELLAWARPVAQKILDDALGIARSEEFRYRPGGSGLRELLRIFAMVRPPVRLAAANLYLAPGVRQQAGVSGRLRHPGEEPAPPPTPIDHDRIAAVAAALPRDFPVLWGMQDRIGRLMLLGERRLSEELVEAARDRIEDIEDTKSELAGDPEFIWQLPMALTATQRALGLDEDDPRSVIIEGERIRALAGEAFTDEVIGVLLLAAGILAVMLPPAGLIAAASELAVAAADLGFSMAQWNAAVARHRAARAGVSAETQLTTFDPDEYWWLAIGLMGAGLGVKAALGGPAFKALKAVTETAETTEEVARAARRVGEGSGLGGRRLDAFVDEMVGEAASRRELRPISRGAAADAVRDSLSKELRELTPADLRQEAEALRGQKGYPDIDEFPLGTDTAHKWRRGEPWGTWCRWSDPTCYTFVEEGGTVRLEPVSEVTEPHGTGARVEEPEDLTEPLAPLGGRATREAARSAARISREVKCFGFCIEFASRLRRALRRKRISGTRIRLEAQGQRIGDIRGRGTLVGDDVHEAILVEGTVFDNLNPHGLPFEEWRDSLRFLGAEHERIPDDLFTFTPF